LYDKWFVIFFKQVAKKRTKIRFFYHNIKYETDYLLFFTTLRNRCGGFRNEASLPLLGVVVTTRHKSYS